ncbi:MULTISPECIES: hypothetical protein [unclassified Burkholderia]|uniref:hypothetical protein n=1 Tax=unclassified Burkholderia TaxID=2613784 RepID=UPI00119BD5AD|nr:MULTISPECIES: hypothetical protein [unclassified Burkholderia]TWC62464.1 hypothetical protein FB600_12046 [Burkholderia sp. SJZ089]TWC95796.1 hypothetical protein FBX98_120100 [Burkholderia sp. SJZ115]TWC99103.1 hypothetical protein FB601_11999 [Burkholderia sp. SJZ091]
MTLQITIIDTRAAQAPDMPSHLFAGAGSDSATFRVTAGDPPPREVVAQRLDNAIAGACLVDYDQATGQGSFVVVDGEAPPAGAILMFGDFSRAVAAARAAPLLRGEFSLAAPTIEQFYDDLNGHDWFSCHSDNPQVYGSGSEEVARIEAIVQRLGGDHAALYDAFKRHHFSGEPWSTPKWDKPARPVDGVLVLPQAPKKLSPSAASRYAKATPGDELSVRGFDEAAIEERDELDNLVVMAVAWRRTRNSRVALSSTGHLPWRERLWRALGLDRRHAKEVARAKHNHAEIESRLIAAAAAAERTSFYEELIDWRADERAARARARSALANGRMRRQAEGQPGAGK